MCARPPQCAPRRRLHFRRSGRRHAHEESTPAPDLEPRSKGSQAEGSFPLRGTEPCWSTMFRREATNNVLLGFFASWLEGLARALPVRAGSVCAAERGRRADRWRGILRETDGVRATGAMCTAAQAAIVTLRSKIGRANPGRAPCPCAVRPEHAIFREAVDRKERGKERARSSGGTPARAARRRARRDTRSAASRSRVARCASRARRCRCRTRR